MIYSKHTHFNSFTVICMHVHVIHLFDNNVVCTDVTGEVSLGDILHFIS